MRARRRPSGAGCWSPGHAVLAAALLAAPVGAQQAAPAVAQQAPPAAGQQLPTPEAELVQRLDSLLPLMREAGRELAAARVRERARSNRLQPRDTFPVGPLQAVAYRSQAEEARRLLEAAWREWEPVVGEGAALLEGDLIAYRRTGEPRLRVEAPPGRKAWRVEVWGWPNERAAHTARERLGQAIASRLPAGVRDWAGNGLAAGRPGSPYMQLITASSAHARACFGGDDAACLLALGLSEGPEALLDWYSAGELAAVMAKAPASLWSGAPEPERRACLEDADAAACLGLAEGKRHLLIPVGAVARRAFLEQALRAGGSGAFERLVQAGDVPVAEALAAAAGQPVEALVAPWREQVMATRPERSAGVGRGALASVAWMLVFSALAIGRRSWTA